MEKSRQDLHTAPVILTKFMQMYLSSPTKPRVSSNNDFVTADTLSWLVVVRDDPSRLCTLMSTAEDLELQLEVASDAS